MAKYLLALIIVGAALLRVVQVTQYPSGLNADEAALGYNAYSLLTTGRDEHGHSWPVNLESFGDFKPAFYAYILIPFVRVFGLTELAVRLPSVIFGVIAVVIIFRLTGMIFPQSKTFPYLAGLLLAVSPWAIHYSRGGWETNLATLLLLTGTYLFMRWTVSSKTTTLLISLICFVTTLYTYQSTRVVAPLLVLGLFAIYRKHLLTNFKKVLFVSIFTVILLVPLAISLIGSGAASRFSGVGILADEGPVNRVNEFRGQHSAKTYFMAKLLHNRPVIYSLRFVQNYFDHFSPKYLFIIGDPVERNKIPETGLLYLTDFILIALGVVFVIKNPGRPTGVIWLWLFVAPVASSLTFQTPSALRSHSMIIPLILLMAAGVNYLFALLPGKKISLVLTVCLILIYSYQLSRYLHEYYIHYPREYPAAWEYGFRQLVPYVESVKNNYDRILVTDKYDQPYILFLFYSGFSPAEFQAGHTLTFRDKFNFSTVRNYDKYHFSSTDWEKVRDIHSALIVAAPEDIPDVGVNIVKTIYFPNGDPAFKIVSN